MYQLLSGPWVAGFADLTTEEFRERYFGPNPSDLETLRRWAGLEVGPAKRQGVGLGSGKRVAAEAGTGCAVGFRNAEHCWRSTGWHGADWHWAPTQLSLPPSLRCVSAGRPMAWSSVRSPSPTPTSSPPRVSTGLRRESSPPLRTSTSTAPSAAAAMPLAASQAWRLPMPSTPAKWVAEE